ncbi:MAG TPA: hypothetical protein VGE85_16245 [Terracidiphilus sp.]|jgi:hypothetical protein
MFRIKPYVFLGFVVLYAVSAFAQQDSLPSDSELAAITARGRMLYEYDQAAWHASDAVMATHPAKENLGRYIARKTDTGWEVAFGRLNESRDAFLIAALSIQGKTLQEFSVKPFETPQRDTGFYLFAAKGIENALKVFQGVNRQYNVAVLPAPENQLYIYFVPAPTEKDLYPLGADVRFLVSADGGTIIEKRQLHKGLIPSGGPVPPGATIAGGQHTHVLSNVPEDTDVFHVLARKPSIPEYIGTEIAIYEVNVDGTIKIVQRMKKHR